MKNSNRQKWKGLGRKILLAVVLIVLISIFLFGERGFIQWYRLQRMKASLERTNDSLETEIGDLSERIRGLEEGDTLEIETVARHWGMVRPGEEVYVVKEEDDTLQTLP
jgi:cell division protein FtsB